MANVSKKKVTRKVAGESATTSSADASVSDATSSQESQQAAGDQVQDKPTPTGPDVTNVPPPTQKKSLAWLTVLALLLALAALAGSAYTWYAVQVAHVSAASTFVSQVAAVDTKATVNSDRIDTLQKQRANLVSSDQLELRVNDLQAQAKEQFSTISAEQTQAVERMDALQSALDNALTQGAQDFILDDVGQLLKAANVSLLVLGNRDGAINAMRIAEQQLQDLGDPRFTTVRQAILSDVATLEAVELVDFDKLSSLIQGLVQQIDSLELVNEPVQKSENVLSLASDDPQAQSTSFSEGLREMGRDFLRLFTIKVQKVDQPPRPLLAPEERYFLNLNLSVALNKAELAALQKQPVVFKNSVEEAKNWVQAYFDVTNPAAQKFVQDLDKLAQTDLDIALPSVVQGYSEFIAVRGQP